MENFKQFLFALSATVTIGFVSIIFVLRWVFYFKEGLAWDGGLAEFNWHPVLIVTGFIFLQGIGEKFVSVYYSLKYRIQLNLKRLSLVDTVFVLTSYFDLKVISPSRLEPGRFFSQDSEVTLTQRKGLRCIYSLSG